MQKWENGQPVHRRMAGAAPFLWQGKRKLNLRHFYKQDGQP